MPLYGMGRAFGLYALATTLNLHPLPDDAAGGFSVEGPRFAGSTLEGYR